LRPCAIALKEVMLVLEKRNCFELFQKKKQIPHWSALNAGSPCVVANRRVLLPAVWQPPRFFIQETLRSSAGSRLPIKNLCALGGFA